VIFTQLQSIKETMDLTQWKKCILVYEPIWALNTGKLASADQTQEAAETIRGWLKDNCGEEIARETRILFGGPVTETNAETLIKK
jgi:triosephosphate isomerase